MTEDFVAIDMERCNSSYASVTSVGWARVRSRKVALTREWTLRPEPDYAFASRRNLQLTGMNLTSIANGESFRVLGPKLARRMQETFVVCHNLGADMNMFDQAWWVAGLGPTPEFWVVDTVPLAKKLGFPAKLPDLYELVFGEPMGGVHHNAQADAAAAAELAVELTMRMGYKLADVAVHRRSRTNVPVKVPVVNGGGPLIPIPPVWREQSA